MNNLHCGKIMSQGQRIVRSLMNAQLKNSVEPIIQHQSPAYSNQLYMQNDAECLMLTLNKSVRTMI